MCEQRSLSYRLRVRKTANVKRLIERLIERLFRREHWTRATEASQGWQAIEDELRLSGWSRARRVVEPRRVPFFRRVLKRGPIFATTPVRRAARPQRGAPWLAPSRSPRSISEAARSAEGGDPCLGDLRVLARFHARYANCADHLAIDDHRHAAFQHPLQHRR